MAQTYAIILAGGKGLRLKTTTPKQLLPLGEKPVIAWSLDVCNVINEIDIILVVLPDEFISQTEDIVRQYNIHKALRIIPGGATRQESALHALNSTSFNEDDILLFHDAARPFIKQDIIKNCIDETRVHGAVGVYIPVNDTVAEIKDNFVVSVPVRENIYYAQTPQAFKFSIIHQAHLFASKNNIETTDDVSLVLAAGFPVKMIKGDYSNFKITTDFDYQAACRIAATIYPL